MKVVGIIAEYNPFHKGHAYQIRYARSVLKADYIIVAMSGDFVQRGTPALMPKHVRAEMALKCGADLVLELPVSTATASAEAFAAGGVSLLSGLGVVDELCFGSECGDTKLLMGIAEILTNEPEAYRHILQQKLRSGMSFPAARSQALVSYIKTADIPPCFSTSNTTAALSAQNELVLSPEQAETILSSPNNILGIEYCKAILRQNSRMIPHALLREGRGYHDTDLEAVSGASSAPDASAFPSASGIRKLFTENPETADFSRLIPEAALSVFLDSLKDNAWLSEDTLDLPLHYKLLLETEKTLHTYPDLSDALIRRILKFRNQYEGFSQFADLLKTRDITRSAICRSLLHIFLDQKEKAPERIPYARVLGFCKNSSSLLGQIKKSTSIPLLTKAADAPSVLDAEGYRLFRGTCESSNLYEMLLCHKTGHGFVHELKKSPRILL